MFDQSDLTGNVHRIKMVKHDEHFLNTHENSYFQVLCSRLHIAGIYLRWSDLKNKICQVAQLK